MFNASTQNNSGYEYLRNIIDYITILYYYSYVAIKCIKDQNNY